MMMRSAKSVIDRPCRFPHVVGSSTIQQKEMGHNRVRGRKPHEIYSIICFVGQNFFRLPIALSIHRILMILVPREVIHQRRRRDDTSGWESEKEQLIKSLAQTRNNESTLSNKLLRRHLGTDHIVQIPRDGK